MEQRGQAHVTIPTEGDRLVNATVLTYMQIEAF
jgi:hypothetical protein